jgi:hypothetical protein
MQRRQAWEPRFGRAPTLTLLTSNHYRLWSNSPRFGDGGCDVLRASPLRVAAHTLRDEPAGRGPRPPNEGPAHRTRPHAQTLFWPPGGGPPQNNPAKAQFASFRASKTPQSARQSSLKLGNFQFWQEMLQETLRKGSARGRRNTSVVGRTKAVPLGESGDDLG